MTAEHHEPVGETREESDPPVGSVGEELALLLQVLAERSTVPHPLSALVRDHPDLVEQATDTVVGWIRGAQDALGDRGGRS